MTETLYRGCDVGGLVDVGLPERRGPVDLVGHHSDDRGIVRDGFYTDVPVLLVYAILAVFANVPRGLFDLIRKGGGDKNLREERVGIEREIRVRRCLVLGRNLILGLRRGLVLLLILPVGARVSRGSSENGDACETQGEKDRQSSRHESEVSF